MPKENNNSPNTIKYSIWETNTEKSHTTPNEDSLETTNKHNAKRNRKNS